MVNAGWFDDPTKRYLKRYWDGNAWTEHVVANSGTQLVDRIAPAVKPASTQPTAIEKKPHHKKWLFWTIGGVAVLLLLCGFGSCVLSKTLSHSLASNTQPAQFSTNSSGGSNSEPDVSATDIPLSKALDNGRTLWYLVNGSDNVPQNQEDLGKGTRIEALLVFDGGKVTGYHVYDPNAQHNLTFGDLKGLSDDEIIDLCKKAGGNESSSDYQLSVITDETGNATDSESIDCNLDSLYTGGQDTRFVSGVYLTGPIGTYGIYDTQYSGYSHVVSGGVVDYMLATRIQDPSTSFTFDAPNTPGIKTN